MNRNLLWAIVCISLIAVITLLSALPIGFSRYEETVPSLPLSVIAPVQNETQSGYMQPGPGPVVHRVTFTNTWLPRQSLLPRASACLYNSKLRQGAYVNARWQISTLETRVSDFTSNQQVVELGRETRTVELTVDPFVRWSRQPYPAAPMTKPVAMPVTTDYPEGFDTLYLFLVDREGPSDFYPDCSNLQPADLAFAKRIAIV